MAENRFPCGGNGNLSGRETVCIETNRILDSCRDRDCYEDVRVYLTDFGEEIICHTNSVRTRSACITWTNITVDPVQFNRGFYSVTIKFYIKVTFEACVGAGRSQEFDGIVVVEKRVILYGSESNVSIFKSSPDSSDFCSMPELCCSTRNVPIAVVEVVDPIVLGAKIVERRNQCRCCCCVNDIPNSICERMNGVLASDDSDDDRRRYLAVSLGIFSVIRIVRPAQYLINATEYAVPDKECIEASNDDPCSIFKRLAFPSNEFYPPSYTPNSHGCCGGGDSKGHCGC
ncbi:MAG: hypothetical protein UH851_01315 [Clostridia bacterium]|nr:hypothetical protein [Clostridia bacterium]